MSKTAITVLFMLSTTLPACRQLVRIASPTQPMVEVDDEVRKLIDLVNDHRDDVGCKDLAWSTPVAQVAQRHSDDMARRNFFNHKNPDGMTPFQRLDAAGIRYFKAAENIAAGQPAARRVFESWMNSPGHRRNIEDCAFRVHGIGFTPGSKSAIYGAVTYAWTHNFVLLR